MQGLGAKCIFIGIGPKACQNEGHAQTLPAVILPSHIIIGVSPS